MISDHDQHFLNINGLYRTGTRPRSRAVSCHAHATYTLAGNPRRRGPSAEAAGNHQPLPDSRAG